MKNSNSPQLTKEQEEFLQENQEMLASIPYRFVIRTLDGTWGEGITLTEAFKNAGVNSILTRSILSLTTADWEIDKLGSIIDYFSFHDRSSFRISDIVSPETIIQLAIHIADATVHHAIGDVIKEMKDEIFNDNEEQEEVTWETLKIII